MNQKYRLAAVSGVCGFALAISTLVVAQQGMDHMGSSGQMEPGAMQMHQMMMDSAKKMVDMKMAMDKNTDKMFALSMAMHHADGIKMARIEIKYGHNAKLKAIARNIVVGQTAEKAKLEKLAMSIK